MIDLGLTRAQVREMAMVVGPSLLLVLAAFWLAFQFVEPAPPRAVVMTTGGTTGAYHGFGRQYAEILGRSGIKVEVQPSAGSVENLARLKSGAAGVALLQGGIASGTKTPEIVSLGRVFLEPLWVFYRSAERIDRLSQLKGKRIAVGPEGSGTRVLALDLLRSNEVTSATATLLPDSGQAAADALLRGEIDAVFLALAPSAPLVGTLLRAPGVRLLSFAQAEAYTRIFPYLTKVVMPHGMIDLVAGIPAEDTTLVAPEAALVARADLHPALVGLLVEAAQEIHGRGGTFHRFNEYPKPADPELPMSEDAARVYKQGPPFLQRYLPFWLATFIDRMDVLVLPLATILIPLIKIVPMVFDWRIKSRLLYWYGQLKRLERSLAAGAQRPSARALALEIERIDQGVRTIPVPVIYAAQFYELRAAVDLVRQQVSSLSASPGPGKQRGK